MYANWMRVYWSENASNDIFHFSVSIIELEFQPIGFLAWHFFVTFIRKLTQTLILTLFFRIMGKFNIKRKNTVRFSIIKIRLCIIFIHLRSKLTSEICPKAGSLRGKTGQNCLKVPTLLPFNQKPTAFIEKRKTLVDFLL